MAPTARAASRISHRRLSLVALALLVVLVLALDLVLASGTHGYVVTGLLDEPAHAATAALVLAAAGPRRPLWIAGFVLGAVAIDIDHLPQGLGSDVISTGTRRPFSHSLLTIAVLSIVALTARGRLRALSAGAALGVATHLGRDSATGGVALLWPLSAVTVTAPYALYAVLLAVLAARADARMRAVNAITASPAARPARRPPRDPPAR